MLYVSKRGKSRSADPGYSRSNRAGLFFSLGLCEEQGASNPPQTEQTLAAKHQKPGKLWVLYAKDRLRYQNRVEYVGLLISHKRPEREKEGIPVALLGRKAGCFCVSRPVRGSVG